MSTLSETEVEKLFSGAPQYFARSEGPNTGAPNPSVAFPWDETLDIRDLTDHAQIEDEAWGSVTALPHITRLAWHRQQQQQQHQSGATGAADFQRKKKRAHFYPKCRERPNMLSMQGLEKGTMGYSAALELSVADWQQEEQFGFDSLGRKAAAVVEARQKLLTSKDPGLRYLEESAVMEQLIKNGRRYLDNNIRDDSRSTDLYNELFLQILHPPTRVLDHQDPYSLSVQIQALLKVFAAPNVWVDFSRVEWRIRLGQVLWGTTGAAATTSPATGDNGGTSAGAEAEGAVEEDGVEDGATIRPAESAEARYEERYWLLLQILLACELWIRLDAITEADEAGTEHIKPREIYRFQQDATPSVKWSMLLARCWLENVEVTKTDPSDAAADGQQHHQTEAAANSHSSWLVTLTKRISGSGDHHNHHGGGESQNQQPSYAMTSRHGPRQVKGLTHFARRLRWPDIEAHEARVAANMLRTAAERTPLNSPLVSPLPEGRWGSYFGPGPRSPTSPTSARFPVGSAAAAPNNALRAQPQSQPCTRRRVSAELHRSGWLSKSYISGLVLPGEGIGHFLMAALLENDSEAMRRLGPVANLSGGFVYSGKSFWSTACVVGRVIAAAKGSVECMGWISSVVTPQGLSDGWVNIAVTQVPADLQRTGKHARIWGKLAIEKESSVLGNGDPDSVFAADFIIPFENVYNKDAPPPNCDVELLSLKLFAPVDSVHTTPTEEEPPSSVFSDSRAVPPINTGVVNGAVLGAAPEIHTRPAAVTLSVSKWRADNGSDEEDDEVTVEREDYTFCLSNDVYFVTAHPCVPSQHVKILKSPSSPTIREIDTGAGGTHGRRSSGTAKITSHPLHKYYDYTAIHLTDLLARRDATLEELLAATTSNVSSNPQQNRPPSSSAGTATTPQSPSSPGTARGLPHSRHSSTASARSARSSSTSSVSGRRAPRVLVVDCITGFQPLPQSHEIPLSPVVSRSSSYNVPPLLTPASSSSGGGGFFASSPGSGGPQGSSEAASEQMHSETRRRQFGSDMEVLVRALCAEKGWNALISRRRRGCLACAIREAGALGWKVIVRVD